jgi:hypothetical protein
MGVLWKLSRVHVSSGGAMATAGNISYAIKSTAAAIATALGHAQETNRKKPLVVGELFGVKSCFIGSTVCSSSSSPMISYV